MRRALAFPALLLLLVGCKEAAPVSQPQTLEEKVAEGAGITEGEGDQTTPLPEEFAQTGWRVRDDEGAIYTTFLDDEGRYRDVRNGDPWQEGAWDFDEDQRLCFSPDDENGSEVCWRPDRMDDPDHMIVTSQSGKRVKLERVDYSPPDTDEADGS